MNDIKLGAFGLNIRVGDNPLTVASHQMMYDAMQDNQRSCALPQTDEHKTEADETRLLHQLESVMRSTYVREMSPNSRKRVTELLCYRYTET